MAPGPLRDRNVLITGITGFVGAHLAQALERHGAVVWGAGPEGAWTPPESAASAAGRYRPNLDLGDPTAIRAMLEWAAPAAVVHLAAQSSAGLSFEQAIETYRVNALGTLALLEAARAVAPGARLLIVGTGEAYGPQPEGTRVAEDAPLAPVSPYALSKAAGDSMAEFFGRVHRLDVVRTRSFGHIGAGQTDRFVVPSIARQIAEIEAGGREAVVRVGNLSVTRDLCDVRDVAEAYVALLEQGRAGAAYNVCRGVGVALADLVRDLCSKARVPVAVEVDPARMRPVDVPYLVGDPTLVSSDTGWRPSRDLGATLDEVLESWRR